MAAFALWSLSFLNHLRYSADCLISIPLLYPTDYIMSSERPLEPIANARISRMLNSQ